jgi:Cellulase (glycosyl hydrolase family 5)
MKSFFSCGSKFNILIALGAFSLTTLTIPATAAPKEACVKTLAGNSSSTSKVTSSSTSKVTSSSTSKVTSSNAQEFVNQMGAVGMDLDWAMSAARGIDSYRSNFPKMLKDAGVTHVRIRTMTTKPDAAFLAHLKGVVQDSLNAGLVPIIAYQADSYKNNPNPSTLAIANEYWKQVSNTFSGFGNQIAFDLIIEPTDALNKNSVDLNQYLKTIKSTVRAISPNRIVFLTSRVRSNPEYLNELDKSLYNSDPNVAVQFHGYASGPSKTNLSKLWTTGTAQEQKIFEDYIKPAVDFRTQNNVPIWFGAIMFGNYNEGNNYNINQQIVFAKYVNTKLRQLNIPYAINSDRIFIDIDKGDYINKYKSILDAIR